MKLRAYLILQTLKNKQMNIQQILHKKIQTSHGNHSTTTTLGQIIH